MLGAIILTAVLVCLCYTSWRIWSHIAPSRLWGNPFTLLEPLRARVHFQKPQLRATYSAISSNGGDYPRLSLQPSSMKSEYDVVVIGSGYGGGVAASRMARAGKRVCVLERGKERWPGTYSHTYKDAIREYCVTGRTSSVQLSVGKATALYHTIKGKGQDVFLGCGLGGSSLINAGVFLRPDERILKAGEWPKEIRGDTNALTECECSDAKRKSDQHNLFLQTMNELRTCSSRLLSHLIIRHHANRPSSSNKPKP